MTLTRSQWDIEALISTTTWNGRAVRHPKQTRFRFVGSVSICPISVAARAGRHSASRCSKLTPIPSSRPSCGRAEESARPARLSHTSCSAHRLREPSWPYDAVGHSCGGPSCDLALVRTPVLSSGTGSSDSVE